mmetsp:Transcript_6247/g.23585  ORF Transcript_6247/g.23585 Transcript_6247/m.23585 type:complete len:339 (+) Transcript_6247:2345-3361(+)
MYVVRSSGPLPAGNASQKYWPWKSGCMSVVVAIKSAERFCSESKPRAQDPTTRQTPSGFTPCRCCLTTGDPNPMQSTTRRAVTGLTLLFCFSFLFSSVSPNTGAGEISSSVPFGCTTIPPSAARSITNPPLSSKFFLIHRNSKEGLTPQFRISWVTIGGASLPKKKHLIGLNSVVMHSSTWSGVNTPKGTSAFNSGLDTFHSCSLPFKRPRSTTTTFCPRCCSAVAIIIPSVPPHTATSKSHFDAGIASEDSVTNTGAGPASSPTFMFRIACQAWSARSSAARVVPPPAPLACVPPTPSMLRNNRFVRSLICASEAPTAAQVAVRSVLDRGPTNRVWR